MEYPTPTVAVELMVNSLRENREMRQLLPVAVSPTTTTAVCTCIGMERERERER